MNDGGPLAGVRVADFTWAWAGPHGTLLLALLGAEVIKIESRTRLDHSRVRSLMSGSTQGGPDASPLFNDLNLNKLSLTLNLRTDGAKDLVRRLVGVSDVVTQNMRPGVLDRLGLGYDDLRQVKPDLVMLSSSAVGATGPERTYAGYAPTFASLGGTAHVTGYADRPPLPLSGSVDLRVGTASAVAVLAALHHRERTGKGQHIDLSSTDVMTSMMGDAVLGYELTGRVPERSGNRDAAMAPHGCYRCRGEKRWVSIAVASDAEWRALVRAVGDPTLEDARFADPARRWHAQDELDPILERWTAEREVDQVVATLQAAGVAALPVHTGGDIARDTHVVARGVMRQVEHPLLGDRAVVGAPFRFAGDGEGLGVRRPAPLLGEHNDYVLGQVLGLPRAEIEALAEAGVLS